MKQNIDAACLHEYHRHERLMGNSFSFTIVGDNEELAAELAELAVREIRRIERLLTTFDENSQVNQVNANAGIRPVQVDAEVFDLVERSLRISSITDGAFDITYGSIDKRFWNFDREMTSLPDAHEAMQMTRLVDYRKVITDRAAKTIFLAEPGMRIGFGGIGKGYAAGKARDLLVNAGVTSGIVNASGDLVAWGNQADGRPWTIGIADPDHADQPFSMLNITDMAVATSGNYEKFVMIDGKKYSHTINPKTGMPVTGIKSVTVISPNPEIADAMATPITIMGVKAGISLVNQVQHLECIIIDDHNRIHTSKNINLT